MSSGVCQEAIDELLRRAEMLCNQAGVLTVHCDTLGPDIDPNFGTSRAFIKTDIAETRKAIEKVKALKREAIVDAVFTPLSR